MMTTPRHDGWTPARQRQFLETLSITGLVRVACEKTGLSREAAYNLRQRPEGVAFAIGWGAALLIARGRLEDVLMERAIEGQTDTIERDEDAKTRRRHRHDNRLAMGLLARLDRFADGEGTSMADARDVAADWAAFLDLVEAGGDVARFLADRRPEPANPTGVDGPCQLRKGEVRTSRVWWQAGDGWRTNFPPPDGERTVEWGKFGDSGYERRLSETENELMRTRTAVISTRQETERRAFFGIA